MTTPEPPTCLNCYWFKLRWRDGSGNCWQPERMMGRHADEPICEHFAPRVVWVKKDEIRA